MKKAVLSMLMLLSAMGIKAQQFAAPDSENTGVAVFKGDVKGVPDGTVVNFWYPENGDYIGEAVAKFDKGKFTFKKMINENAKYLITLGDDQDELVVRTAPGTTTITGFSPLCSRWMVENDNPLNVEKNAFNDRRVAIEKEYEKEVKHGEVNERKDVYAQERFYINSMCEFMKNRPYGRYYMEELRRLFWMVRTNDDDQRLADCKKKVGELCIKLPLNRLGEFQDLYTKNVLNVGDYLIDFKLYEHDG